MNPLTVGPKPSYPLKKDQLEAFASVWKHFVTQNCVDHELDNVLSDHAKRDTLSKQGKLSGHITQLFYTMMNLGKDLAQLGAKIATLPDSSAKHYLQSLHHHSCHRHKKTYARFDGCASTCKFSLSRLPHPFGDMCASAGPGASTAQFCQLPLTLSLFALTATKIK
jgi:hypothetical protein